MIKRINWSEVDWSKTSTELASELGCSKAHLSAMRGKFAPNTLYYNDTEGRKANRKFEAIQLLSPQGEVFFVENINEFVRNNPELFDRADAMLRITKNGKGFKKYSVAANQLSMLKRGKYKKKEWKGWRLVGQPDKAPKRNSERWRNVDWTRSSKDIAAEFGVVSSVVSEMRAKYAPDTRKFSWSKAKISLSKKYDWTQIDWSKSNSKIAEELGVAPSTVRKARRFYAKQTAYKDIDWEALDWNKDNHTLATETGRVVGTVARKRTEMSKKGIAPPNHVLIDRRRRQSRAKRYELQRVNGEVVWKGENLYDFVRNNPELFVSADIVWKNKVKNNPKKGLYCNATKGLLDVASGRSKAWKGWILRKKG